MTFPYAALAKFNAIEWLLWRIVIAVCSGFGVMERSTNGDYTGSLAFHEPRCTMVVIRLAVADTNCIADFESYWFFVRHGEALDVNPFLQLWCRFRP